MWKEELAKGTGTVIRSRFVFSFSLVTSYSLQSQLLAENSIRCIRNRILMRLFSYS